MSDGDSDDGSNLDNDVYTVERVVDCRTVRGKAGGGPAKEYFIKWGNKFNDPELNSYNVQLTNYMINLLVLAGYPDSDNTWEPEGNIIDPNVIVEFFKRQANEKKYVKQSLTQLAAQVRKGDNEKFEKKMQQRRAELERKQEDDRLARARKIRKALKKSVDDDDGGDTRTVPRLNKKIDKDNFSTKKKNQQATPSKPKVTTFPVLVKPKPAVSPKPEPVTIKKPVPLVLPQPHPWDPRTEAKPVTEKKRIVDVGIGQLLDFPKPPLTPKKTGFEKGYRVKGIVGVSLPKNKSNDGLTILVEWESVDKGDDPFELVSLDVIRIKEPQMVIEYFQQTITFHSDDDGDSDDSDSDCSSSSCQSSDTSSASIHSSARSSQLSAIARQLSGVLDDHHDHQPQPVIVMTVPEEPIVVAQAEPISAPEVSSSGSKVEDEPDTVFPTNQVDYDFDVSFDSSEIDYPKIIVAPAQIFEMSPDSTSSFESLQIIEDFLM